jgi:hypothetical protein
MSKLTKKSFCRFARGRSGKRRAHLKKFRRTSIKAGKVRKVHLRRYCKGSKSRKDKRFCKKAKRMNTRRLRADKRVTGKLLRLAGKRHRELVTYCR